MLTEKELKIKVGVLKRSKKDVGFYEKEKTKQLEKIASMRSDAKYDDHDIRKQQEVLAETEAMLPESYQRLEAIAQEIEMLLEQVPEGTEWACIAEANELLHA
ncbi:tubulin binding cofactor A [Saprolegnia diclina VS20]|uniref:Tubulin-specific chaperone A n=1 Tax=Saprolegnia diclina (strain VS20) TaxID=1156394 RepID=T0QP55_SAPDV|nr:tubulin binding cofactor A [Saprolegnia diclina VS20]EQC36491.1 tubulin binding cofactor A [Saprolegnia diclina VS20]|eukprot:XP_008609912.1 tubulin binding cofactor A [Saprolegnia diclina VS20]